VEGDAKASEDKHEMKGEEEPEEPDYDTELKRQN